MKLLSILSLFFLLSSCSTNDWGLLTSCEEGTYEERGKCLAAINKANDIERYRNRKRH